MLRCILENIVLAVVTIAIALVVRAAYKSSESILPERWVEVVAWLPDQNQVVIRDGDGEDDGPENNRLVNLPSVCLAEIERIGAKRWISYWTTTEVKGDTRYINGHFCELSN